MLANLGPRGTAFALLLLGHVLADFAFQTDRMVQGKHRLGPLVAHGLVVTAVQAIVFLPFLTIPMVGLIALVGATHVAIDAGKARLRASGATSLRLFIGDQALHLVVLLVAWSLVPQSALVASPVIEAIDGIPYQGFTWLTTGAVYLAAFVFLHHGGNALVRGILPDEGPGGGEDELSAGRTIGTLERLIVLVLALAAQWSAIVLVIAAKSIARFEELKDRTFAEYYLVGTLASVLVAVLVGLGVQVLV